MSEVTGSRRERRKAQTRAGVREVAQRLFAERGFDAVTIADVAAAADVAVQTVFNHFETKEALFFDARTPWVEGAAAAVAQREPGSDPVAALRTYLEGILAEVLERESGPEGRHYLEALRHSPALRSRERTLVERAGELVTAALDDAVAAGDWPPARGSDPTTAHVLSRLVADVFLAAGRVLVLENRRLVLAADSNGSGHRSVREMTAVTLTHVEQCITGLARQLVEPPPDRPR